MTVSAANPPFNEYTATPGATVFPYTFKVIKSDDMKVLVNSVAKQIGIDYTLSGVGANDGGNVTFLAPMTGGENVVARMDLAFDRQTDYQQNGDFLSPTVNSDFDRIWLAIQQVVQSLKSAIKLPFTTTEEQSISQSAAQRANTVLAFDASGNLTISTTDAENVLAAQAAAAAAAASAASINPADLVHKSGAETITGVKTFSTRPVVGTAAPNSNDTSAASTAYADSAATVANTAAKSYADSLSRGYAYVRDEKPSGTDGGTFAAAGWRTRTLNTKVSDANNIVTLTSNQFTLPAGTYRIFATAMAPGVQRNRLRLANITDGTAIAGGNSAYNGTNGGGTFETSMDATLRCRFTITSPKAFELQHYCQTTVTNQGFGISGGSSSGSWPEVFAEVEIWKEG